MGFIIFTSVVLVIAAKNMKSIKDMKEEIPDETALKNEHSKEIGNKSQLVNETRQSNLTTTGYTSSPIPASTDKASQSHYNFGLNEVCTDYVQTYATIDTSLLIFTFKIII
uniref:Uncharacterized protein n=1 Tax=Heterorhabditis bacteriophora TaxID=37862 RepID=A0A1I7XE99_HETBA